MFKVKYYDTIKPTQFELKFDTRKEAVEWITEELGLWYNLFMRTYPKDKPIWNNPYFIGDNKMGVYIPGTSVCVSCEIVEGE